MILGARRAAPVRCLITRRPRPVGSRRCDIRQMSDWKRSQVGSLDGEKVLLQAGALPAPAAAPTATAPFGDVPAFLLSGAGGAAGNAQPSQIAEEVPAFLAQGRKQQGESDEDALDKLVDGVANVSLTGGKTRILLVLDLNGLLVHRIRRKNLTKEDKAALDAAKVPQPLFAGKHYYCWLRPGCKDFVEFLFSNFDILVWSSARIENVQLLVDLTMESKRSQIVDTFCQEHCEEVGKHPNDKFRPLFIKPLNKVWDKHPQYSQLNTLLLDDSHYKAVLNPPGTSIHPKEWINTLQNDDALHPNGRIRSFLQNLADSAANSSFTGVPKFVTSNTFNTGYDEAEMLRERDIAAQALEEAVKQGKKTAA